MSISISSPITGSAQTGLTSPTYTVVTDRSPASPQVQQVAVSALGGTQAGVRASSVSDPFVLWIKAPAQLRALPLFSLANGRLPNVPFNTWTAATKKGLIPASGLVSLPGQIESRFSIPAGAETYDAANMRAMISAHIGLLDQVSAALGDAFVTGTP